MNREIKFRGKRIDNGEWVYGFYVYCTDGDKLSHRIYISFAESYGKDVLYPIYFDVVPETVEQCTGLKDKNNKEIYEGDIVKLTIKHYMDCSRTELTNEETTTQMVVFEHHTFGFTKGKGIKPFIWILGFDYDIEVIGNIYKNPELLEVEQ